MKYFVLLYFKYIKSSSLQNV